METKGEAGPSGVAVGASMAEALASLLTEQTRLRAEQKAAQAQHSARESERSARQDTIEALLRELSTTMEAKTPAEREALATRIAASMTLAAGEEAGEDESVLDESSMGVEEDENEEDEKKEEEHEEGGGNTLGGFATFSPDGTRIATASEDGTATVCDAKTGEVLRWLKHHTLQQGSRMPVKSVDFSPDGTKIVTCSWDKTAAICDAETGEVLLWLRHHAGFVYSAVFSPDGTKILTAGHDHNMGGSMSSDNMVVVCNANTGKVLARLEHHTAAVQSAAFSPDGAKVVTASDDNTAAVCDAEKGAVLLWLKHHTDLVTSARFAPDGTKIVTASYDKTAVVCSAKTGEVLLRLGHHTGPVRFAMFSPDGANVVTASADSTALVCDAKTGNVVLRLEHSDSVNSAVFSRSGTHIVTASLDKTVAVAVYDDVEKGEVLTKLTHHTNTVRSCAFSSDRNQILTASEDKTATVCDAKTGEVILLLDHHTDIVGSANFSPDDTKIVTASKDKTAAVCDASTGKVLRRLEHHTDEVTAAAFSPDGSYILTGSKDKTAAVCDATTGNVLVRLEHHTDQVISAQFSPDASRIVTTSKDTTVVICDAKTGEVLINVGGLGSREVGMQVRTAKFSLDGSLIVISCWRRESSTPAITVVVCDATTGNQTDEGLILASGRTLLPPLGKVLLQFGNHTNGVSSAAFSPCGTLILTASEDGTAAICDAKTGDVLALLEHHTAGVYSAAFSDDGRSVVTASKDNTATACDLFWLLAYPLFRGVPPPSSSAPTLDDLVEVLASPRTWNSACPPNPKTADGRTAMLIAASHRNATAVQKLLDAGLPLDDTVASTGQTVLHMSARPASVTANAANADAAKDIAYAILKKSTKFFAEMINLKDAVDGSTALSLAVNLAVEHRTLVNFLLDQKADPLIVDDSKRAPIHFACVRGHVHCATSLIANFANVDAEDGNGRTPLLISAIQGSVPLVFLLLQHGARHDLSDNNGWLPLSYSLMPLKSEENQNAKQKELRDNAEECADLIGSYDEEGITMVAEKKRAGAVLKAANAAVTANGSPAAKDAQVKAELHVNAIDGKIGAARDANKAGRPADDRYETIAMALLKKDCHHLDAAIEDDVPLFKESLERHYTVSKAELVCAFYDPTDSYDNDLYHDPLLQCAIDLAWTAKVLPSALWSLMQFSFFLLVVCLLGAVEAGQLMRNPHSLDLAFDTIFIGENWDEYGVKEFGDIGNVGELWPWIENVFLGGVYPDPAVWCDDTGVLQASPVAANEWVGRPRMRTLEGSPAACAYSDAVVSSVQCFSSDLTQAPSRWTNRTNTSHRLHPDGFGWQSPGGSAGDVGWTHGVFHQYPDAGLVVTMPEDKGEAEALVAKLKAGDWINLNTRAFIAEFTAYNANTGMYTVGQIMVEMSQTGVYMPSFQFRTFPRVSYSFTNTRDIARLVLEVIFLIYLCGNHIVGECTNLGERWEDPVKEDAPHWKAGDEKEQDVRKDLALRIESTKPTLGSILVGNLEFDGERAQRVISCIKKWGDCVVIRPYFYEAFNYFDIGLILCFAAAVILQVVQLVAEMTALPKICAGNAFVPGTFVISQMHSARMYLIAFGSFFCWCKMFEYLRIRESFATMFFIIWGMMAKLGSFVVILLVVLLAFTSLDFIAFGSARGRSQTFMGSLISRFQSSLGDVDFESAASMDRNWGMFVLIFFIFVAVLLLLNLLIAVMSEAYEEVKETAEARWAYVQIEMLVAHETEQAENTASSGGCCGRCGGGGGGGGKSDKSNRSDTRGADGPDEEETKQRGSPGSSPYGDEAERAESKLKDVEMTEHGAYDMDPLKTREKGETKGETEGFEIAV